MTATLTQDNSNATVSGTYSVTNQTGITGGVVLPGTLSGTTMWNTWIQFSCDKTGLDVSVTVRIFEVFTKLSVTHVGIDFSELRQSVGGGFRFVIEAIDELLCRSYIRLTNQATAAACQLQKPINEVATQ